MKKVYLTMVAMLCGAAAMAQDIKVSMDDVKAKADGTTQSTITINWEADDIAKAKVIAFSINVNLPEGVKIAEVYNEDEEENVPVVDWSASCKSAHSTSNGPLTAEGKHGYLFAAYSTSFATFKYTKGSIVTFDIVVDPSVKNGEYSIVLDKMEFASTSADNIVINPADVTAKLTIEGGTGINSINAADDANAPIYNVAGQIVNKAQKGIYIQNGKKILK